MRELTICTGNSRQAATWPASKVTFPELYERLKTPMRTAETVLQYQAMPKGQRDEAKDKGGFMAGTLKGTRRKKDEVVSRSMIALDADHMKVGFLDELEYTIPYEAIFYTTHSHTPESPRARILIPLERDASPDECVAIARYLCADMGMEMFDTCSFEVNQLMYWPTCPKDGEYICECFEGEWLDPDTFLDAHPDWKDPSKLPRATSETQEFERQKKKQEDPLSKDGVVGAFCRAHDIHSAIHEFLADVYEESVVEGRYDYIPGEGSAGVVIYDDKFAYSHHATDPAGSKLLNAFDLVRIHKFGDDKDSFQKMCEFAMNDEATRMQALTDRQERAQVEFAEEASDDEWKKRLVRNKKSGALEPSLFNLKLILANDTVLKNIVFNQLADNMEIAGPVPWKHPEKFWRDADDAQLICYVDDNYGSFAAGTYNIAVTKVVDDRSYHPIRQMFAALPEWDGVKRVETCLVDYLGAADTPYVRAITKKTLCAAYTRVMVPGIKFDYMPVLNGPQGIGKSTFIEKLGMEWYSDSLNLSDMNDKTAAEKLQGYWIMEIGELAGMKKADLDKVKAFISRKDDKYRASFGRRVTPHPRQCVFFGTTNAENGYLRDVTGNRRYWNVSVNGNGKYHPWELDDDTVKQIWAEVILIAKAGEKLYLPAELEEYAQGEQRMAMEQDDREGLVKNYLELLLPENWADMDMHDRRAFIDDPNEPTSPEGTVKRMEVSNIEIWCECFSKPKADLKPSDSYAISAIMVKLGGWEKISSPRKLPIYGNQRVYRRL